MSATLNCILMCASRCAYYIDATTGKYNVTPGEPYAPTVNFIGDPTAINGPELVNACLVGQNANGIIVAYRGTIPFSWHSTKSVVDWLQDFWAEPMTVPGIPGTVHTGFYNSVQSVHQGVLAAVKALLAQSPGAPLYVTGHSKGGGMAPIGAYLLSQTVLIPPDKKVIPHVVTFAGPKPGDPAFKSAYQAVIPGSIRYENYKDIVPLVPPSSEFIDLLADIPLIGDLFKKAENWDYEPVGTLEYITDKHKVIHDKPFLMAERLAEIAEEISKDVITENFSSFGTAHTLDCPAGYPMGTCPGLCTQSKPYKA